jgi:hypothetical protein
MKFLGQLRDYSAFQEGLCSVDFQNRHHFKKGSKITQHHIFHELKNVYAYFITNQLDLREQPIKKVLSVNQPIKIILHKN